MKMASNADEFKEELQRLAHVTKSRNDERMQASEQALRLFGPIRNFLLRFNEALGEFGKIEVAGPLSRRKIPTCNGDHYSPQWPRGELGVCAFRKRRQLSTHPVSVERI